MRSTSHTALRVLVVAIFVASGCSTETQDPEDAGTPPLTATTAATTTATTQRPPASTATTSAPPGPNSEDPLEAGLAAFVEWSGALAREDTGRAWDLMAESSQRSLGSRETFLEWGTELAEGWGAWSRAEDLEAELVEDAAGRTTLLVRGLVTREGMEEQAETTVFLVLADGEVVVSPFEEFGNVARGLVEDPTEAPLPDGSGAGRRIVYGNEAQRVWLVDDDEQILDTYLVSGRRGVPAPGEYEVFSKSELAFAGHDGITMRFMVRFATSSTSGLAIGFHSIPNRADGSPLQTEEQLGEYHSAGCVRQSFGHAADLYEWAGVGTRVVVLP